MPKSRSYPQMQLRGLYFPMKGRRGGINVPVLICDSEKIPVTEAVLKRAGNVSLQRTSVGVSGEAGMEMFDIYFRYDESWGTNEAIKSWRSDKVWKGDLLVLRGGKRANYVDIVRAKDREAAEQAVDIFLTTAGQITTKKTVRKARKVAFPEEMGF